MSVPSLRRISFILWFLVLFIIPGSIQTDRRTYGCQCTDYVYNQRPDIPLGMGHAKDWLYSSRVNRLPYDQVPQVDDVAVFLHGEFGFNTQFGHVAIVTEVNEERTAFSIAGWDGFKNDCRLQTFENLPVTSNTFFIHQILDSKSSTAPYMEWPRRFQGIINLDPLEF